jgi:hypothetical protein
LVGHELPRNTQRSRIECTGDFPLRACTTKPQLRGKQVIPHLRAGSLVVGQCGHPRVVVSRAARGAAFEVQRPLRLCSGRHVRGQLGPLHCGKSMNDATPIVFVINDEDTVRRALRRVIRFGGFRARWKTAPLSPSRLGRSSACTSGREHSNPREPGKAQTHLLSKDIHDTRKAILDLGPTCSTTRWAVLVRCGHQGVPDQMYWADADTGEVANRRFGQDDAVATSAVAVIANRDGSRRCRPRR